ncbi:MAG: hypothetical protein ACMVY4_06765 [Minwuia sp.]|uniref:hypothetical protein n=1 Tax=Minwuia sp. TaxID=2493630 RepID=UPI003A835A4F
MFDITGDDIAQLDDKLLRELVGLLCEAECREAGLDSKAVTWGGNQNAADGGFDVVVRTEAGVPGSVLLQRSVVGIQVKKPDLAPAKAKEEMKPGGSLREDIANLVAVGGCYLIASSGANTSNAMLRRRQKAMRDAMSQDDPNGLVELQFLDRGQIATWVRQHPSMVLWVRERVGRPLIGWHPYGNWANAPGGVEEVYLADEELRISNGRRPSDQPVDAVSGINELREALRSVGVCLRLAGLSGVGKTRLVQALFDERVGSSALPKNRAYYCDVADDPQPPPKALIENLNALDEPGIVIVDNCPPELHASLREAVIKDDSCVSLLTVEYDVRDDLPTKTGVYLMEPASLELTERLIRNHFDHITAVDAQTIAEFSGGNARVAIALAETVEVGETLSGLRDETLLERLFVQRHDNDQRLLRAAEALSLAYSFDGEDTDPSSSELAHLGNIVTESADDMFGHVTILRDRKLVQSRSRWRAVLPHALANRLASNALKRLPKTKIVGGILGSGSERLIKSFTRRLAFLHDNPIVGDIAADWLRKEGWVGDVGMLNAFGIAMFKNLAPIAPETALEAIERSTKDGNQTIYQADNSAQTACVRTLKLIAHDPKLFERCCAQLQGFALNSNDDEIRNSATERLISLFPIHLSGTHATLDQRISVINDLLRKDDEPSAELAIEALDAALEATRFSSGEDYQFGARPRDYGYRPKSWAEQCEWYRRHLDALKGLALRPGKLGVRARDVLRQRFRGLWHRGGVQAELSDTLAEVQGQTKWVEGWIAVKETIYFDAPKSGSKSKGQWTQLESLERQLRPSSLVERARAYALQDRSYGLDHLDGSDDIEERDLSEQIQTVEEITRRIGRELAEDGEAFNDLLMELVSPGGNRIGFVGEGLAEDAKDPEALWRRLHAAAASLASGDWNLGVFYGFLIGLNRKSPKLCNKLLEEAVQDDLLGPVFPNLQCAIALNATAYRRLLTSIDHGVAATEQYEILAYGQSHAGLSDDELVELLTCLGNRENSDGTIKSILKMRLFKRPLATLPEEGKLMEFCRVFLCSYDLEAGSRGNRQIDDHALKEIARKCLRAGQTAEPSAKQICKKIAGLIGAGKLYLHDIDQLLCELAKNQPSAFMDAFLEPDPEDRRRLDSFLLSDLRHCENPVEAIDTASVVAWCSLAPKTRWLAVCRAAKLFQLNNENRLYEWRDVFSELVAASPNLATCLGEIYESFRPTSWSGSLTDKLTSRLPLLETLTDHDHPVVAEWAKRKLPEFRSEIEASRNWEADLWPRTEESFE